MHFSPMSNNLITSRLLYYTSFCLSNKNLPTQPFRYKKFHINQAQFIKELYSNTITPQVLSLRGVVSEYSFTNDDAPIQCRCKHRKIQVLPTVLWSVVHSVFSGQNADT